MNNVIFPHFFPIFSPIWRDNGQRKITQIFLPLPFFLFKTNKGKYFPSFIFLSNFPSSPFFLYSKHTLTGLEYGDQWYAQSNVSIFICWSSKFLWWQYSIIHRWAVTRYSIATIFFLNYEKAPHFTGKMKY